MAEPDTPLFQAIVDGVPEAIVVAKPDGEIVFLNRTAVALFGYPAAAAVGRNIAMLVPPQPGRRADPVKWLARWAAEAPREPSLYIDFLARRSDGHEMPVDVRVAEGEVAGQRRFFISVRDNSQRRREQAALKEANLRAARILMIAEDAIVSCDGAQTITFFNLKAEQMFGYRAEEAVGQPLAMLLPPAARGGHASFVRAFGEGPQASRMMSERREVEGIRRSGEVFPMEAAITKVDIGGAITYTAHIRDITARKAAQHALSESERRFHALFDHAVGALALLSPDGTVLEINRAARDLTVGAAPLTGRPLWELPWLGADDAAADPAGRERLKEALAVAASGLSVRYAPELRDGPRLRRIDLWLTPILDAAGRVIYVLAEGHEVGEALSDEPG